MVSLHWGSSCFSIYTSSYCASLTVGRHKEGTILFNDALNTFYLRLYGVGSDTKNATEDMDQSLIGYNATQWFVFDLFHHTATMDLFKYIFRRRCNRCLNVLSTSVNE